MDWTITKKTIQKNIGFLALVFVSFALYLFRLNYVPVHLNQDELQFGLNAYHIGRTLQDANGSFLPFYFWHLGIMWATPIIIYQAAFVLLFLPFSESSIRVAPALTGVFICLLTALVARRVTRNNFIAIFIGFLTATSPVLYINSRLLLDNIYTIPFILLWLLGLLSYRDKKKKIFLFAAGLTLGVGVHSYHAAKIIMPIFFLATFVYMGKKEFVKGISPLTFATGFLLPIVAFIPWLISHPDTLLNQVSYIGSIDSSVSVERGLRGVFSLERLGLFTSNYLAYLSPNILFIEGDRSLIHSTGAVGAFLWSTSVLLLFGILAVLFKERNRFAYLILFGFFVYPIAPAIVNEPQRISRGLMVVPFVMILSAYGLRYLVESKEKMYKFLVYSLFVVGVFQFSVFLMDYFGEYRKRSFAWFNYDIKNALVSVIQYKERLGATEVYIDANIPFIDRYYDFYALEYGWEAQPKYYDADTVLPEDFPGGSIILSRYDHTGELADLPVTSVVTEPNGDTSFYVYQKW